MRRLHRIVPALLITSLVLLCSAAVAAQEDSEKQQPEDQSIKVTTPGKETITYDKATIKDLGRFTIGRITYFEKLGDYYAGRIWDFQNDQQEFARAQKYYLQGMTNAADGELKERLKRKYQGVEKLRTNYRSLRKTLAKTEDRINAVEGFAGRNRRLIHRLRNTHEWLEDEIDDLEDDLHRDRRRHRRD